MLLSPIRHSVARALNLPLNRYGLVPRTADLIKNFTDENPVEDSVVNEKTMASFDFQVMAGPRPLLIPKIATHMERLYLVECRFVQAKPFPEGVTVPREVAEAYGISLLPARGH